VIPVATKGDTTLAHDDLSGTATLSMSRGQLTGTLTRTGGSTTAHCYDVLASAGTTLSAACT
jgi:uncharacterized Zn-binding protein involved in type VI secretion